MSLRVLTQGGAGGASASIFVTGLDEASTVSATHKIPVKVPNPAYVGLPDGYTQLEYIESTGTQYIDTGVIPSNHTTEIKYETLVYNNNEHVFGTSDAQYHFTLFSNKYYWGISGGEASGGSWTEGIKTLKYNVGDSWAVIQDGVTLGSGSQITSSNVLTLGRRTNTNFQGRYYYCKITDKTTGNLVRDFIPAIRNSDSTIGLYDLVSQTFFENAGTGTFVAGAEIPQYITEYVDGKTVNGKWVENILPNQPLIPTMTSNTTPSGVASANYIAEGAAWQAFDGDSATYAYGDGSNLPWYVQYAFESDVTITSFYYHANSPTGSYVTMTHEVRVSQNGTDWETIWSGSFVGAGSIGNKETIILEEPKTAKYIRYVTTSSSHNTTASDMLREFQAYGDVEISGHEIEPIKKYGTWTVTATDGTDTAMQDVLVDAATEYDIAMAYSA